MNVTSSVFPLIFVILQQSFFVYGFDGNNWNVVLTGASNTGGFEFINAPASETLQQMVVFVTQGGGGTKFLEYPSNISFGIQGNPTLSTAVGSIDVLNFVTYTNGTKWLGFLGGKGF